MPSPDRLTADWSWLISFAMKAGLVGQAGCTDQLRRIDLGVAGQELPQHVAELVLRARLRIFRHAGYAALPAARQLGFVLSAARHCAHGEDPRGSR